MSTEALATTWAADPAGPSRERILDAADVCADRWGLRRMSMNDVAQQAGLSRGSVYRYFSDRDALIEAMLTRRDQRFVAAALPFVRRRRTLATQVAEAARFILAHGRPSEDADESGIALARLTHTEGVLSHWIDFWVPFLDEARARGEVRADLDVREAGEWIMRILVSLVTLPSVTFDPSNPTHLRRHIEAHIVRGFC